MQIKQDLYLRQGHNAHKITNFTERLPSPQSDLALQLFKEPYDFRFLPVTESSQEQEIEQSMTKHFKQIISRAGNCQKKSKVIAEYSLKRTDGPIGIAEYRLLRELPRELVGELPPTEILESKLNLTSNEKAEDHSNNKDTVMPMTSASL